MSKYLSDLLFIAGFILLEYGLYLFDIRCALVVGGSLLIILSLVVAYNGANRKSISTESG
jgi:hypothetical protein